MGKETFLSFIDYKKAFDSVDRNLLFFKLSKLGISGRMYRAILALYECPQARVVLDGQATDFFSCPIGVKQGDSLSPTLFAAFINDLATEIRESGIGITIATLSEALPDMLVNILLYADDIVLLAENEQDLQGLLNVTERWCRKWRLEVNMSKTNILHIRGKQRPQSRFTFLFNMRPVMYCQSYKYLGVNINEYLDFSFTIDKLAESGSRALGTVIAKMIKHGGFSYNIYSMLYDTCVTSILDYSAALTGFKSYESLEKVQMRAIRAFLGLPKNACNAGVMSEVSMLAPRYRTQLTMIRHYHRMLKMDNTRLTKKIFLWDKNLNDHQQVSTWFSEIRSIFESNGLNSVLVPNAGLFDLRPTINIIKKSMFERQAADLREECSNKPKLRTFMLFKDFNVEPSYISKNLNFQERRLLAKTRLGCLTIRLETGRYEKPKLPEAYRVCLVCNSGQIESEEHFLFWCGSYEYERHKWYNSLKLIENFDSLDLATKLDCIFNNPEHVKPTARFIATIFDLRSKILNGNIK